MSDILSQEEIDALLKGSSEAHKSKTELIAEEKEALLEICGAGVSEIETFLLTHLKEKASIEAREIAEAGQGDYAGDPDGRFVFSMELLGAVEGETIFLFKRDDVNRINDLLVGGDGLSAGDTPMEMSAEVFMSVMTDALPNTVAAMSRILQSDLSSQPPKVVGPDGDGSTLESMTAGQAMLKVTYSLNIGKVINSVFSQMIPFTVAKEMVDLLLNAAGEEAMGKASLKRDTGHVDKNRKKSTVRQDRPREKTQPVEIQSVSYPSFDDDTDPIYEENLDFILDVPLRITVELGSTKKPIKDILNTNIGSIIELDNMTEDYVDVLVNGKLIARGEVVVVDENFGVRIMELYTNGQKDLFTKE